MARLQILLDNPTNTYFPSSVISGSVDIQISKPIKATKIVVKLIGKASVKFHFGSEGDTFKDKQSIVNRELLLWSSSNGKAEQLSNNQSFQFSFVLPENSPSTFKSKKGKISYKIVAEISIPWSLGNNSSTVCFIVQPSPIILSENNLPKDEVKENENVKATLSLPRTIFAAGESIPFSLEIFNYSRKNTATVESGIECITYSGKRSKTSDTQITKTKAAPHDFKSKTMNLHKRKSTNYSRDLEISKDLVATFDGHSLIKVQYTVFAIIRFKNSTKEDTKLSIPIILRYPNVSQPEPSSSKVPSSSSTNRVQPTAPTLTNSFASPRPPSIYAPENQFLSFEPPPPYDAVMMKS